MADLKTAHAAGLQEVAQMPDNATALLQCPGVEQPTPQEPNFYHNTGMGLHPDLDQVTQVDVKQNAVSFVA